jgi:hypothetical protein
MQNAIDTTDALATASRIVDALVNDDADSAAVLAGIGDKLIRDLVLVRIGREHATELGNAHAVTVSPGAAKWLLSPNNGAHLLAQSDLAGGYMVAAVLEFLEGHSKDAHALACLAAQLHPTQLILADMLTLAIAGNLDRFLFRDEVLAVMTPAEVVEAAA